MGVEGLRYVVLTISSGIAKTVAEIIGFVGPCT